MRGGAWNSLEGFGTFLTFHLDLPGIPISKEEFCQGWSHQFSPFFVESPSKNIKKIPNFWEKFCGLQTVQTVQLTHWLTHWRNGETWRCARLILIIKRWPRISWGSPGGISWQPWCQQKKDAVIPAMWYPPWLRHTHPCLVNLVNSPEITERWIWAERCMGYVRSESTEVGFELRQARPAFPAFLWSPKLNHNFPLSKQSVVNQCSPWSNTENHICSVVLFIGKKHIYRIYIYVSYWFCIFVYLHICIYVYTIYIYIWYMIWYDMIWKHGISYHSWHVAPQGHHLRFQFVPPCRSRLQWHRQPWHRWHRHRIPWCIRCHTWHHRCIICRMHSLHIRIRPGLNLIELILWRLKIRRNLYRFWRVVSTWFCMHKQNHGFRKVVEGTSMRKLLRKNAHAFWHNQFQCEFDQAY